MLKGDPLKIRERDGAYAFDGRHSMGGHNNQPDVGISGESDAGEGA